MEAPKEIKVIFVGDHNVGKTCIVNRAVNNQFGPVMITIGAVFASLEREFNNEKYLIQIWDTSGQEKYKSLTPMYYRQSDIALLVYSINDEASFKKIDAWMKDIRQYAPQDCVVIIVSNKNDLEEKERIVPRDVGSAKAQSLGLEFVEVSAKSGMGIQDLLDMIPKIYTEIPNNKALKKNPKIQEQENNQKSCKC
ncbi:small GTP-binding protein [Histomonas meleagridis]|uniref:small GTP-binding protein n=1 Tax=Histomonas meleagridis TaxID=135588 RepID=UPI00355A8574|nr:small GTP-binding protein [Histomonas meleagridis]